MSFEVTHPATETNGPSPKAVVAAMASLMLAILSSLAAWALDGFDHFGTVQIALAAVGVGHALLVYVAAWLAHPGDVIALEHGIASDAKLSPEAKAVIDKALEVAASPAGQEELLKLVTDLTAKVDAMQSNVDVLLAPKPPA